MRAAFFALAFTATALAACAPETPEEKRARICSDNGVVDAWSATQDAVRQRLKAPSTADFSGFSRQSTGWVSKCEFWVSGFVDSQNSFGAKLRSSYFGEALYLPSNDQWSVKVTIK